MRKTDVTPVGMAATKDGKLLVVALGRADHVVFVDPAMRRVTSFALVGRRVWGVALGPDETTLYVVNGLSDDLSIVDMKPRKTVRTVPVGRVPCTVHPPPLSMPWLPSREPVILKLYHYPNFRNAAAVYGNGPPMERSACHGPGGQFTKRGR